MTPFSFLFFFERLAEAKPLSNFFTRGLANRQEMNGGGGKGFSHSAVNIAPSTKTHRALSANLLLSNYNATWNIFFPIFQNFQKSSKYCQISQNISKFHKTIPNFSKNLQIFHNFSQIFLIFLQLFLNLSNVF